MLTLYNHADTLLCTTIRLPAHSHAARHTKCQNLRLHNHHVQNAGQLLHCTCQCYQNYLAPLLLLNASLAAHWQHVPVQRCWCCRCCCWVAVHECCMDLQV